MLFGRQNQMPPAEFNPNRDAMAEIVDRHKDDSVQLVNSHEERSRALVDSYNQQFELEAQWPGQLAVQDFVDSCDRKVHHEIGIISSQYEASAQKVATEIRPLLSKQDQRKLAGMQFAILSSGSISSAVKSELEAIPDKKVRNALKVSLDNAVMLDAKDKAIKFGVGSNEVEDILKAASSKKAKAAMQASLDSILLKDVRTKALSGSPAISVASRSLYKGSCPSVVDAIGISLDKIIFATASRYCQDATSVPIAAETVVSFASSETVESVFVNTLENGIARRKADEQRWKSQMQQERTSAYDTAFTVDDLLKSFFGDDKFFGQQPNSYRQTRREAPRTESPRFTPPVRPEARPQPARDFEAERAVSSAVSKDKQWSWLKSEDLKEIRRVMNLVVKLRKDASAAGDSMSDRKIYMHFRRQTDKGEKNGKDIATPQDVNAYKIIDAFMGGKLDCKLPF